MRFLWQGLRATEIDAVVTNMCTFAPTPSLSALLVHRFGMRPDTLTYSLVRPRSRSARLLRHAHLLQVSAVIVPNKNAPLVNYTP